MACAYCGKKTAYAKGLCMACYQRQRRNGTLAYKRDRQRKYGNDVVGILKKRYPKFSKVALCMIRNPEYGVDLSADAKRLLRMMKKEE